ncbi:hypothetical protein Pfo_017183 [Paulownia fortunei]|nr:hypothetical protein Pfo_017183 [Paulownia fortunei]
MDTDWTFSSCSWLWEEDVTFKNACSGSYWTREEDKAFENALALYYNDADRWDKIAVAVPGKTIEDLKLHYEELTDDVVAIESGKVPLPHYPSNVSDRKKKKKSLRTGVQRGIPWTEEEHRRFLHGLQRFGRGDWKSISRYCVLTKSNSQVASHAQKYFKRLSSANNEGKRPSINDITSVHPESMSVLEKPTTSSMPGYPNEASNNAGKQLLHPTPFCGMCAPPFSSQTIAEPGTSAAGVPAGSMFTPPFASQTIHEPAPSVGMPTYHPPVPLMQDSGVPPSGSFDIPSASEIMDLDMFVLPHFLDID